MLMAYGMFVFEISSTVYQELQRQTSWRHAAQGRVGLRPARQFLGPADDTITLSGTLLPQFTGGQLSLDALRELANSGGAWPLIEGTGWLYGLYTIEQLNERKSSFMRDGAAQQIQFDLTLQRLDEDDARSQAGSIGYSAMAQGLS